MSLWTCRCQDKITYTRDFLGKLWMIKVRHQSRWGEHQTTVMLIYLWKERGERLGRKNLQTQDSGLRKSRLMVFLSWWYPWECPTSGKKGQNHCHHQIQALGGISLSQGGLSIHGGYSSVKVTPCRWCSWTKIWAEEFHGHQSTSLCHTDPLLHRGSAPVFSDDSWSTCLSSGPLWSKHQDSSRGVVGRKTCEE